MDISVPIVGFIFVCIIFPHLVKNKPQFYMAFAVVLVILALDVVVDLTGGSVGLSRVLRVLRDVLWIVDLILLVLATGGLSLHELSGEFKNAYEVMRRGEDTPTLVVPKRDNPYAKPVDEGPLPPPVSPGTKVQETDRTIPLE